MLIDLAERRLLPDSLVRLGMRRLLRERLQDERAKVATGSRAKMLESLFAAGPIAIETAAANEQHYEVPTQFYERMLGPHLKYSSCYWEEGCEKLADAEAAMLRLTCLRAKVADGQRILELGCGWGSLTLWMGQRYPKSQVVAVSNSHSQQAFIQQRCRERNLNNVDVRVQNVAELKLNERFDLVVSVEMFEHMRNWRKLLTNIVDWLEPDGKCFLHTFCHRQLFYPFAGDGRADWMAKHFFSGGVMPSFDVLQQLEVPLRLAEQWQVSGNHYAKTCQAWLRNLDQHQEEIIKVFTSELGNSPAKRQLARWRMFVMACEELFAFSGGEEWFVSHALLAAD